MVEQFLFNNMFFLPAYLVMPRYVYKINSVTTKRHDGLRASYVATPPSGHDLALPEF